MGKRRRAREAAVQYHFWRDLQRGEGPDKIDDFWEFCPATQRVREFAQPLIDGMVAHLPEIDERIRRYCENYEFRRISAVDRNFACDYGNLERTRYAMEQNRARWRQRAQFICHVIYESIHVLPIKPARNDVERACGLGDWRTRRRFLRHSRTP